MWRSTSMGKRKSTIMTSMTTCSVVSKAGWRWLQTHDTRSFAGQQTPQTINSPGPRLVLLFKAGSKSASGFKAQYRFETGEDFFNCCLFIFSFSHNEIHLLMMYSLSGSRWKASLFSSPESISSPNIGNYFAEYQIPGTPRPGMCHFTYRSTSRLEGRFNSPRHPQNYPNDLNCTYLFLATPSQQVGKWDKSIVHCPSRRQFTFVTGNIFRSRLCLIISKSGQTTSIPTAVWEIGKLMGK